MDALGEPPRETPQPLWARFAVAALAGAAAATWFRYRQDEEALRLRTAERLLPFAQRSAP